MPSPVTPNDFKNVIPSANASLCEKFSAVLVTLPVLVYKLVRWMFNDDGSISDAFKTEIGAVIGSQLAAPANVQATDGTHNDKITVTWEVVTGAATYNVYRSTANDTTTATLLPSGTGLTGATFDDTTILTNTVYFYWVRAVNGNLTSPFSTSDRGYAGTNVAIFTGSQNGWIYNGPTGSVTVKLWGGGGGGGGVPGSPVWGSPFQCFAGGGGGGSGGYTEAVVSLTNGQAYNIEVGEGGAANQPGGRSSIANGTSVLAFALGGNGGTVTAGGAGGTGSTTNGNPGTNGGAITNPGNPRPGCQDGARGLGGAGLNTYGKGGDGGQNQVAGAQPGFVGRVEITW